MGFAFLSIEMNGSFHLLWAKALRIRDERDYKYFLEEKKNHTNTGC